MATTPAIAGRPPMPAGPALLALLASLWNRPDLRPALWGAVGCVGLYGLVWASTLGHFVFVWSQDENYSHGFLVPLMSLYFANEATKRGPIPYVSGVRLGLWLLAVSALGRLATLPVPIGIIGDIAFLLGLAGMVALLAGSAALKRYGFALFFLVFMVPLPVALYTMLTQPLQLAVSKIASGALNAIGIPVLCEGNTMTLPGDVRMFVAEACSGMRQLTGFLALTTAVAYLTGRPAWSRALLIASSVPIAMTANIVRVITTGIIMYRIDPRYAAGTYHTLEGMLMMGFGLALLGAEIWFLNQVFVENGTKSTDDAERA